MKYEGVKNGSTVTLQCGETSKGPVLWSRDRAGRREDLLTVEDGGTITKHISDTHKHYNPKTNDRSLMITHVSSFPAGLYYCNSTAVCLTVTAGPSMTHQDKCDARSAENTRGHWMPLIVVGSAVLLLVLALVSTRKWFSKKEGPQNELTYSEIQDPPNRLRNNGLQNEFTYSLLQHPANRMQGNGPVGEELYSLAQRPRSSAEDPETPGATD
ncbi:hypothetical protein AOLI_G00188570 [Acnodon oligacanthus]